MPDQIFRLMNAARQRANRAEQTVVALQAEIRRLTALPSPAEEGLLGKFEELLTARIAERDAARRDLADLEALPRWRLEQWLTIKPRPENRTATGST